MNNELNNILLPVDDLLCNNVNCHKYCTDLECYYNNIVSSIDITNLWNSVGRPRSGSINAERLRCKYRYKQAVKDAAYESDKCLNDELFNHLCTKDNDSFWKSWRKRFCSNKIKPTSVLNGKTGDDILPEFTNFYSNVFKPNTDNSDAKFGAELGSLLSEHMHSAALAVRTAY